MGHQDKDDHALDGLLSLDYHERMTQFIRGSTRHLSKGFTVLDFRPLYAVTIHHVQRQLVQEIHAISNSQTTDAQLENLRQLLENYTDALKNFEYIHANRWNTDFVKDIAASRIDNGPGSKFQTALLQEFGFALKDQQPLMYSDDDLLKAFNGSLKPENPTRGTKRRIWLAANEKRERTKMMLHRLVFAVLGGVAIVVPLLLMTVSTVSRKTLVIVTVSIAIFAVTVAIFSSAQPESLLAATAAYASILVVFCG